MALALAAEQRDVLAILKVEAQYIIPAYQRPYSWEYDECLQLFNDIRNAFTEGEDYFIGNIVIAKSNSDKNRLEVIDGQQRLTTLLLLIKVLHLFAPENNRLKECLRKEDWEGNASVSRLRSEIFEAQDMIQFEKVLDCELSDFEKIFKLGKDKRQTVVRREQEDRFFNNASFFFEWITYGQQEGLDIKEFIKYLLQRTYLLPIELTGNTFAEASEKALTIFETLNNRGKNLEDADIFKAKLYGMARKDNEGEDFISTWGDLKNKCDTLNIKIDDVFRYYSHAIRGREGKTSLEINIRKFFIQMDYSPFFSLKYNEIMSNLFQVIEVVKFMNAKRQNRDELGKWLQLIEVYTNQYPRFAVVVYLYENINNLNEVEFIKFLKKIIRFSYYAGATSTIKFTIFNVIRDICLKKEHEIDNFVQLNIPKDAFNYLGLLKYGYALLAFCLTSEEIPESYTIDKLITFKDKGLLNNSWDDKKIANVANRLGNFVITDLPKINFPINRKSELFSASKLKSTKKLSKKMIDFSYESFEERDNEMRELLISFFEGKI